MGQHQGHRTTARPRARLLLTAAVALAAAGLATSGAAADASIGTAWSATEANAVPGMAASAAPTGPSWWRPQPGESLQVQFTGTLDTRVATQIYDVDLFDTPAATVTQLHAAGHRVLAYIDAGTWESWRPDQASFPASVLGAADGGWPGERWLDIRQLDVLEPLIAHRLDLAKAAGFDGVDLDNMDGFTNATGFPLTATDQMTYNQMLANLAHARGLAVGLKNDPGQIPQLVNSFDFAINESCLQDGSCSELAPFLAAGKAFFHIEYSPPSASTCAQARAIGLPTLFKTPQLNASGQAC